MSETVLTQDRLSDAQEKLRHRLGYNGMVDKRDTLYEAHADASKHIDGASTPADAMTATFLLHNTMVHEIAKCSIPLWQGLMSKGELVDLLFGGSHTEERTIDFARPHTWDEAVRPLGIDPDEYVWVYEKDGPRRHGGPMHLGQELLNKITGD